MRLGHQQIRWLCTMLVDRRGLGSGVNLLRELVREHRSRHRAPDETPNGTALSAFCDWCAERYAHGAWLTWGVPNLVTHEKPRPRTRGSATQVRQGTQSSSCDPLCNRLVWWPRGIHREGLLAVVSSRLGRKLESAHQWFAVLRTVMARLTPEQRVLLVPHTAGAEFVRRAAELFGKPTLELIPHSPSQDMAHWLRAILEAVPGDDNGTAESLLAYVSPSLEGIHPVEGMFLGDSNVADEVHRSPSGLQVSQVSHRKKRLPRYDDWAIFVPSSVVALTVRPHGNVEALLRQKLADPGAPPGQIRICTGHGLTKPSLVRELLALGAVALHFEGLPDRPVASTAPHTSNPQPKVPMLHLEEMGRKYLPWLLSTRWSALLHCTRSCRGPWPGQTWEDYWDSWILADPQADHSSLATLEHIVRTRILRASNQAIRGGYFVVSFTAMTPEELLRGRTFRPHRGRWDFEPYAVCLAADVLRALGARPVIYGSDEDWQHLAESDRPYFQLRFSGGASSKRIDWSVEREWRLLGDLDLSAWKADQLCLLVPHRRDALRLAMHSPWPIAIC